MTTKEQIQKAKEKIKSENLLTLLNAFSFFIMSILMPIVIICSIGDSIIKIPFNLYKDLKEFILFCMKDEF